MIHFDGHIPANNVHVFFSCRNVQSKQRVILNVKLPVINFSYEEDCFPIFTDMHGSVNLPDSGGEAVLVDGASMTFHLKLSNHPVLMTWKNTAVSLHFGTL